MRCPGLATHATRTEHIPIDFALYLPESWTEDPARRAEARIPDDVVFKTKIELAIDLISQAVDDEIPGEIVLADSAYGDSTDFRNAVRLYGLDIGVAIKALTKVWPLDVAGQRNGDPIGVQALGVDLGPKAFATRSELIHEALDHVLVFTALPRCPRPPRGADTSRADESPPGPSRARQQSQPAWRPRRARASPTTPASSSRTATAE